MRIAMVAGEASGDMLAAHLMRALKRNFPDAEFIGIGGPKMDAEGFQSWWPAETLAVNGYVDALLRYRELSSIRRQVLTRLKADPPDIFIGVDAPDFNLWLERKLKARGVPTAHYISPSIWAWRGKRVHTIKRSADLVLCLFPFEPALYEKHGVAAVFVGHPLADQFPLHPDRAAAREELQLTSDTPVVAILPGSRNGEVSRLAGCFIDAAHCLRQRYPDIRFLIPLVTRDTRNIVEGELFARASEPLPVKLMFGHADMAMTAADVVLVASGTATLEAALLKRPMVVAYRLAKLSYRIMKRMAYLPYVALPNILAREFVVPEFIQDDATGEALCNAVAHWLDDKPAREALGERFQTMHMALRQDHAAKAASAILALLGHAR